MGLRRELKNDIWKVIDGEKIPEVKINKFRLLVLQLLLESKGFNLGNAFQIADDLEKEYNKIVDDFDKSLVDSNGDLINVLKNINDKYDNKIKSLLDKVEKLKNGENK